MKRCLSIIALSFILVNTTYSQLKLKAFAGINISSLEDKFDENISDADQLTLESFYHRLISPSIGMQFQLDLSKMVNFNVESQLILKGQKQSEDKHVERSLYIELIPSIGVNFWNDFNFGLGPYVGIRPYTYFSEKNAPSTIIYIRDDWDYGGMASLSYDVERMTFRIAYYYGLNTIYRVFFPIEDFNKSLIIDKRNRVFQFGIGYALNANKESGNRKK